MNEIQRKGARAKQLLEDPVMVDILQSIRVDVFDQFRNTTIRDNQKRDDLHLLITAVDMLESKMQEYVDSYLADVERENHLNKKPRLLNT